MRVKSKWCPKKILAFVCFPDKGKSQDTYLKKIVITFKF